MQKFRDEIILVSLDIAPSWTRREAISVVSRKSEIRGIFSVTLTCKSPSNEIPFPILK